MKNSWLKKTYVLFSSLVLFVFQFPFVFAKSKPYHGTKQQRVSVAKAFNNDSTLLNIKSNPENALSTLYFSLRLNLLGLSQQAFEYAMKGFNYLVHAGKLANDRIISIVDFSQPSSKKRLFVIDLENQKVIFNTYVAHGMNSGQEYASQFSNIPGTDKSSLGFYETLEPYIGKNGYSLQLQGLENGINDNARDRAIVMHGAAYVSESFIQSRGFIGRSWGCPAVPTAMSKPIIDNIKGGTCLFIYSPDAKYLTRSGILHPAGS